MISIEPLREAGLAGDGERRPRRRWRTGAFEPPPMFAVRERGGGSAATARRTTAKDSAEDGQEEYRHSRFPAILEGYNVDYDPSSRQFIITPIGNGNGHSESFHFSDLPHKLRVAIQRLK